MPRRNRRKDIPPSPAKLEALIVQLKQEWRQHQALKRTQSR